MFFANGHLCYRLQVSLSTDGQQGVPAESRPRTTQSPQQGGVWILHD